MGQLYGRFADSARALHGESHPRTSLRNTDMASKPPRPIGLVEPNTARPTVESQNQSLQMPHWLAAVPFGLMAVDGEGCILQVNAVAAELLGYTPDELIGSGVERLIPLHMVARHRVLRANWTGSASSAPMSRLRTVEARRKDGSVVAVHIELSRPWQDQPRHVVVTLRDMRPQLALESQLHRLQRMENVGLLAAGAVHDFNNHLNTLELLCSLQEGQSEEWQDVCATTEQLRGLVDSLQRISRSEVEEVRRIDLRQVILEHRGVFERVTANQLRIELPEHPTYIDGRTTDLVQTLVNLLVNALRAHRDAGVKRPVRLTVRSDDPHEVQLVVKDEGVGMTLAQLGQACEPGYTSRGHRGGSGLGLAIARSVAETHGGRLELASKPGHGTTAVLHIPPPSVDSACG